MKKILTLVFLVLVSWGCALDSGPNHTVLAYLQAEAVNDTTAMQALVEPGSTPQANWVIAQVGEHVLKVDFRKIELQTTINADRARVHISGQVKYTFDNPIDLSFMPKDINIPVPTDRSFDLIKINGVWYIQPQEEAK